MHHATGPKGGGKTRVQAERKWQEDIEDEGVQQRDDDDDDDDDDGKLLFVPEKPECHDSADPTAAKQYKAGGLA